MMNWFSFGQFSVVSTILCPFLYFVSRKVRAFAAWMGNSPPPKERPYATAVAIAIMGLAAGSIFQSLWDQTQECRSTGMPAMACMLKR